jgi:hypothetical protein
VSTTYAVKWREPDGRTYLGRLSLGTCALGLEGRRSGGPSVDRQIGYDEILDFRVGGRGDRFDGQPALLVDSADGRYLVTSAGMGAGIVQEVVDRLGALRRTAVPAVSP